MNRKMTVLLVLAALSSLVACKNVGLENDKAVSGDKIYIPSGYKQKLAEMNLSEVAALPYFTPPFVTVAKNSKGEQHAVLFQSSDEAQDVKLPLPYEEIISRFQSAGFAI